MMVSLRADWNDLPESREADSYVAAQRELLLAQARISDAYRKKLDPQDQSPLKLFHFGGLPENAPQAAVVMQIDDHTADLVLPFPYTPRYRAVLTGQQWHIRQGASFASLYPTDPAKALGFMAQGAKDMAAFCDSMTREIQVKSILNKTKHRDAWFLGDYTLNPYSGCSFNCLYCYIRGSRYDIHMEENVFLMHSA